MKFTEAQDRITETEQELALVEPAANRHAELQELLDDLRREAGVAAASTTDRFHDLVVNYRHSRNVDARERAIFNEATGGKK